MTTRHLEATIVQDDDLTLVLTVRDLDGDRVDLTGPPECVNLVGTVEITPKALAQLVDTVNAYRAALVELREFVDQGDVVAGAMERDAPKVRGRRQRQAVLDRAAGWRAAGDLARTRLARVERAL